MEFLCHVASIKISTKFYAIRFQNEQLRFAVKMLSLFLLPYIHTSHSAAKLIVLGDKFISSETEINLKDC